MSNTVRWLPSQEDDIDSYRVENAADSAGPWSPLVTITHDLGDPTVFDGTYFYYEHVAGSVSDWYRIIAIDATALESTPSSPFTVTAGPPDPPAETVALNANYGSVNALQPVTPGGDPIENTQVHVYYKTDYDAGNLSSPVGISLTDATGGWQTAIFVAPGFDYVLVFQKPGEYGPSVTTITV